MGSNPSQTIVCLYLLLAVKGRPIQSHEGFTGDVVFLDGQKKGRRLRNEEGEDEGRQGDHGGYVGNLVPPEEHAEGVGRQAAEWSGIVFRWNELA